MADFVNEIIRDIKLQLEKIIELAEDSLSLIEDNPDSRTIYSAIEENARCINNISKSVINECGNQEYIITDTENVIRLENMKKE
jgi:hypothetical protein